MSTEWFRCSFSLFISDPLSVIRLITLSCSNRYVTHRWLCVYLSLLFLWCTSACLLPGWPWWEGFDQDWWETRWFFNCGKEQKLFWWLLLLKLNQNWHTHSHTHTHVVHCLSAVLSSFPYTIRLQPWQQDAAVVWRQVFTSCFTWVIRGRLRLLIVTHGDTLPQQRRRCSFCRVINPLQYWIISTPGQLAGT